MARRKSTPPDPNAMSADEFYRRFGGGPIGWAIGRAHPSDPFGAPPIDPSESQPEPAGQPNTMPTPPLDPPVASEAPTSEALTEYDQEHLVTYLRLLDTEADEADWTEMARVVLRIDPAREPERAWRAWDSHLTRAKWMTEHGYWHLLRFGAHNRI